jgi:oligopeptidase B
MTQRLSASVGAALLVLWSAAAPAATPPVAEKRPFSVLSPHGARQDDYYWLRDDSRTAADVLDYLKQENAYRDALMAHSAGLRQQLYEELVAREPPVDASVPVFEHSYWYYVRYEPGQEYPIYARRKANMQSKEQVLLDGNALSKGHEFFQIGSCKVSPDGRYLAFTQDIVGRRQFTLLIKDLRNGAMRKDAVVNVEPGFVWAGDGQTVLYVENDPVTLLSTRVRKHRIGSAHDPEVYEEKDKSYYLSLHKSRSEKAVFIESTSTQQSEWRYASAADPQLRFKPVLPRTANLLYDVEAMGEDFVIRTNWQAPNYRIMRAPMATSADKSTWRDIVPHRTDVFVERVEVSSRALAISERAKGLLRIRLKRWEGGPDALVESPDATGALRLVPTPDITSRAVRYEFSSLITPTSTFEVDLISGEKVLKKTDVIRGYDAANYRTEFTFATARDGTLVPVSLAWRKDTPRDGTAPLYQYAYGSYGASSDPEFVTDWVSLLDRGFVVAIAHVRGGQELGRQWYEDGRQLRKKNTFTDFIDVTRFLTAKGYAARDKVFAEGASAGGLLMGAVANMAPQDYRGIIADVPYVDAVTTMLDASIPLTSNEYDEWGNPAQKEYYDYMLSYSPYDNVVAQRYPAMLVTTALWDSQVQYFEPAKWVAKLRATKTDSNPLIFSIDTAAGHGGKSGRFQPYRDTALAYAFILDRLNESPASPR